MGKGKRRYNKGGREHKLNLYMMQHAGWDEGWYDDEEAHYWKMMRENPAFRDYHNVRDFGRQTPTKPKINGFRRKELMEFLKEMHPGLRHKEDEILNSLEKLKILEPVDYYNDVVLPEEAVDIFTTDLPEIVDDAMSIEQIIKWLGDDVKKIWPGLILGKEEVTKESREEAIDWAKYVVETYRRGLKALRRKVRAELEERELQKEVKFYHEQGLDIPMDDFFDDEGLINALKSNGIRYLFQLIFKSRTEIKEIQGIGATRLERIDQKLEEYGLQFMGKEPEKKKKSKKKETEDTTGAKVVDITKK